MLIDPFKNDNTAVKSNENSYGVEEIQKYMIDNYLKLLQEGNKIDLAKKIKEYLVIKCLVTDTKNIDNITQNVINKMFGYDILQKYIDTDGVTDIRAVSFDNIYIKENGAWKKVKESFESEKKFEEYVRYCIIKNNSNINYDSPIAIVSDKMYNLRIEAGISPVNTLSSSIVIRIHRSNININLEKLFLQTNMLNSSTYKLIIDAIKTDKNIVIAGKGGSGKTTLLRAILDKIPKEKSMSINEETTELFISNKNAIQREVIENRLENKKISLELLMKHSLVMSNDVIVVGELKGLETSTFIDSITTGHQGLATVHSDNAINTINRLITLFKRDIRNQMYKEEFIEEILINSIDYLIYLNNYNVEEIICINYDINLKKRVLVSVYKKEEKYNDDKGII